MIKAKLKKTTIAFATLGCKVNQYDTQALIDLAKKNNYQIVPFNSIADIYVVNSCAVTEKAVSKSRKKINQARAKNPKAKIFLCGCWPQITNIDLPNVEIISGTNKRKKSLTLIKNKKTIKKIYPYKQSQEFEEMEISKFLGHSRAIIKIQDGCEQFCSYCIIPFTRGPLRSRNFKKTIKQAKKISKNGYQEIVLTGIHLGLYGFDLKEKTDLTKLLKQLVKIPELKRIRLSSIEVREVNNNLVQLIKNNKKICCHLHIPLQSGSDKILKLMNRPYNSAYFVEKIKKIKKKIPGISITTDVIVGFPDETEKNFQETYNLCEKLDFSKIHVFSFSRRKETKAYDFNNQIKKEIIKKRSLKLRKLSDKLTKSFAKKFINKTLEILSQGKKNDYFFGLSDNYLKICFKGKTKNNFVNVKIKKVGVQNFEPILIGEVKS
ncbi:MAG: tRNA (N(6)-L-threonylcarbamoyladenosine(37)-C(2))-methylthiotransferase MtaB [Patescibacteria group bacterium]|nr:tRNA (N(6)-L-threonylcarbamoyladenosine(37)-C(2))-methylthiotransferase MtaB [Patescibacteria group bacterium]